MSPAINDRFGDGYFFHNKLSGGARNYRELARIALNLCDKFIVVISNECIGHEWVVAEISLAIKNRLKIIVCLIDDADPAIVNPGLNFNSLDKNFIKTIDFRVDIKDAQGELAMALDNLLINYPYPRFKNGIP